MVFSKGISGFQPVCCWNLLVSGTCYYKVVPSKNETNVRLKILNPVHTFIDRNSESPYLKE